MSLVRLLRRALVLARRSPHARLALAAAATALLAIGCGGDADGDGGTAPTTGTLSGEVRAGAELVPGATVTLAGPASRTATTGADGRYALTALPSGQYTATVTLPDAFALAAGEPASRSVTVAAGGAATASWTAQRTSGTPVVEVVVNGTQFTPALLDVAAGTTVRWRVTGGTHTVTPASAAQPGAWTGTGAMNAGDAFTHTFTVAGQTYDYFCQPHQALGMTGRVRVAP